MREIELGASTMATATIPLGIGQPRLASDEVLKVARLDAERAYRDLTLYRISMVLEADGWHVDYYLKDPHLNGGGPNYIIDPMSGAILHRKYEQ
jgi:hypothetical protein